MLRYLRGAHVAPAVIAVAMAGCANGGQPLQTASTAPVTSASQVTVAAPVSLISPAITNRAPPVEMAIADTQILPAINLYRFKNKLEKGPVQRAGADLNGDGSAEALVYLDGPDCTQAGCPLIVFAPTAQGYRALSLTAGVVLPVSVAGEATGGWRDLVVGTATGQPVRLVRSAAGYPPAIMDGIAVPRELAAAAEMLIGTGDPSAASQTGAAADQQAGFGTQAAAATVSSTTTAATSNFVLGGDAAEADAGQ